MARQGEFPRSGSTSTTTFRKRNEQIDLRPQISQLRHFVHLSVALQAGDNTKDRRKTDFRRSDHCDAARSAQNWSQQRFWRQCPLRMSFAATKSTALVSFCDRVASIVPSQLAKKAIWRSIQSAPVEVMCRLSRQVLAR